MVITSPSALARYVLSFFKSDWKLLDYPIKFQHQIPSDQDINLPDSWTLVPWSARIINWLGLDGSGDTKEEAYADLQQKFSGDLFLEWTTSMEDVELKWAVGVVTTGNRGSSGGSGSGASSGGGRGPANKQNTSV